MTFPEQLPPGRSHRWSVVKPNFDEVRAPLVNLCQPGVGDGWTTQKLELDEIRAAAGEPPDEGIIKG